MKHVWVKYRNGADDIVNQRTLDDLLARNSIEKFYRASESRWIILGVDRIRGSRRATLRGTGEKEC